MPDGNENRIEQMGGSTEVPLKERLRSSGREQNFRPGNENDNQFKEGKGGSALEDQNAAAIQSIINANSAYIKEPQSEKNANYEKELIRESEVKCLTSKPEIENVKQIVSDKGSDDGVQIIESPTTMDKPKTTDLKVNVCNIKESKISKRKETKPVKKLPNENKELISEQDIVLTPTLIVCSKDDVGSFLGVKPTCK